MPTESTIARYRIVQDIARDVLAQLSTSIRADDTERSIADKATAMLRARDVVETWYYDSPALVLAGSRSCLSVSGRDYQPAQEAIGSTNLVTVDLSPMMHDCWGDCARSFYIEHGRATPEPTLGEFLQGRRFLDELHAAMPRFVHQETTFHELFEWTNARIDTKGFQNLDFRGNVGHSIATRREDRQYIENGNHARIADVPFFTFEPHVSVRGGKWGFKHEDIFFFDPAGSLQRL